jgi:hypothetical protein
MFHLLRWWTDELGMGKERCDRPNLPKRWVNADQVLLYDIRLWGPCTSKNNLIQLQVLSYNTTS